MSAELSDTKERIMAEFCEVVLDNNCTAPPEDHEKPSPDCPGTRARCFACGLPACPSCSTIRRYHSYGRQRICATCEQERFPDGEARVLVRAHHRAGYPSYTLADATRDLAPSPGRRWRATP
jgi:hypothetical protein